MASSLTGNCFNTLDVKVQPKALLISSSRSITCFNTLDVKVQRRQLRANNLGRAMFQYIRC